MASDALLLEQVSEYEMIKSLTIERFRCFRNLELTRLGTINLLVGENASGKTAFLEALFLGVGAGPELALRLRGWRGLGGKIEVTTDRASFEEIWTDLFFHFDHRNPIIVRLTDSNRSMRSLVISYKKDDNLVLPLDKEEEVARPIPLDFEYRSDGEDPEHATASVTKEGITITAPKAVILGVMFGAAGHHGPNTVKRYSDLVKANKEADALSILQAEFPQILGLSVAEHLGQSVLFATVKGIPERKLPLELVSMGINKFFGILLSILASPKGVVIVDEIDNGFHHSKLVNVWKALFDLARANRVQIFASTHSRECISALGEALGDKPEELGIIHLKRTNGESTAIQFSGKDALCALDQGFDPR